MRYTAYRDWHVIRRSTSSVFWGVSFAPRAERSGVEFEPGRSQDCFTPQVLGVDEHFAVVYHKICRVFLVSATEAIHIPVRIPLGGIV